MLCMFLFLRILQRMLELEASEDDAGFNLNKLNWCSRNIIGQRARVDVPGQHGGNITMCGAIAEHGVMHNAASTGPDRLRQFSDGLYSARGIVRTNVPCFVVICWQCRFSPFKPCEVWKPPASDDGVPATLFTIPQPHQGIRLCLEVGGVWLRPYDQMLLFEVMDALCGDITP